MADNVQLATMVGGDICAADDIGGVKHQRVKVGHGANGSYVDTSAAAPLPVEQLGVAAVAVASGSSIGSARVVVTTPGTRVGLASNPALSVTVRAATTNPGTVYLGGIGVTAANGFELAPGEAISMDVSNTSAVYVDASVAACVVSCLWIAP